MLTALLDLKACITTARRLLDHLTRVPADVQAHHDELMQHPVYRELPAEHHQGVRAKHEQEWRARRLTAAGVGVFNLEHALPDLIATAREERTLARQAAGPLEAYVASTGGKVANLPEMVSLQVQLLDEARRARFDRELATATPATVHAQYRAALLDDTDFGHSLVKWVEDKHGSGWSGAPVPPDQIEQAKALRRSIDQAQNARVPAVVAELEQAIAEAQQIVSRATTTGQVRPINPRHDQKAAKVYESELEAVEDAAAQVQRALR